MDLKKLSGLFILTLLAAACVTEYNATLPENDTKILFVDGNIIGNTDVTFYITQSFSLNYTDNKPPEESYVNNAILNIVGSNGYKSPPAINQGKGAYRIQIGNLDDDVEYGIQIEYDGNTYQSTLSKPLYTPEIDTVYWIQPEPLDTVSFYISTHDDTDRAKFYLWNYTEDWEINVAYATRVFYDLKTNEIYTVGSAPYFYCWKKHGGYKIGSTESLSENKVIDKLLYQLEPKTADDRFSKNGDFMPFPYSITVTQKAISQSAYEYYQNRMKLNEEMGGLFTPQPSELSGNITCFTNPAKKVLGYIETVKNISQKRFFIYAGRFPNPLLWPGKAAEEYGEYCKTHLVEEIGVWSGFYYQGYRPISTSRDSLGRLVVGWAPAICVDCREKGGTKDKPDFWPNDHK